MLHLPNFSWRYPENDLAIGVSERQVDPIHEGVDGVIQTGELNNSSLIARPLGRFCWLICASPDYLWEYGVPPSPEALSAPGHAIFLRPGETGR